MSALFPEPPGSATRVPKVADPTQPPSANIPPTQPDLGQDNGSIDAATTRTGRADWPTSGRQVRHAAPTIAKSLLAPALPPAHSTRHFSAAAPPDSKNYSPTLPDLGQSVGSPDAPKTPTGQTDWPTSARQDRGPATIAKTSPAPTLPPVHNTRHTGAAAPPESDAEAARAAAASRQRNSLFHTREGAATESIPDLAIALGTMALPFGPSITAQMVPRFAQRLLPKLLLPEYSGKTSAVLFTNEGRIVRFESGSASPKYGNYPPASHTEGKAAIWMRENDSSGGVLFHNHPGGTCRFCDRQTRTLLPTNATLRVVPPAGAVPSEKMAKAGITNYIGDAKLPTLSRTKRPSTRSDK
jgi:SCP1.201-like deaminase